MVHYHGWDDIYNEWLPAQDVQLDDIGDSRKLSGDRPILLTEEEDNFVMSDYYLNFYVTEFCENCGLFYNATDCPAHDLEPKS